MPADEKALTKKLAMVKFTRHRIVADESRIIYTNNNNQSVTISSEYISEKPSYFNIKKPGKVKDLRNVSGLDTEKLRRQFNAKATNKRFLSPKIYYGTVIHMLQNRRVGYPDTAWGNLHVSQYNHDKVDKKFLKFCNYIKTIRGENLTHFPRNMYIYKKKYNGYISNQTVQKGDIYLPDIYYFEIGHHVDGFVYAFPRSNYLQKFLTPKDNLSNKTTPETINLFSLNAFKLPQKTLVKTTIENYMKK